MSSFTGLRIFKNQSSYNQPIHKTSIPLTQLRQTLYPIQPITLPSYDSSSIILADLKSELSLVKSDIRQLIRAENTAEDLLMMEKLQIINMELRRQVEFMKDVEGRLRNENKELQLKSTTNLNYAKTTSFIPHNYQSPTKIQLANQTTDRTDSSYNKSSFQESQKQFMKQRKHFQQQKKKHLEQIIDGHQRMRQLQSAGERMQQNVDKLSKEVSRLQQQNSKLKQQTLRFQAKELLKDKELKELKSQLLQSSNRNREFQTSIMISERQVKKKELQIEEIKKQLSKKEFIFNYELQNENKVDRSKLCELKQQMNKIISVLNVKIQKITTQNIQYRKTIEEQKQKNQYIINSTRIDLQQQQEKQKKVLEHEIEKLEEQLYSKNIQIKRLEEQEIKLKSYLEEEMTKVSKQAQFQDKYNSLLEQMQIYKVKVSQLLRQKQQLSVQMQKSNTEISSIKAIINASQVNLQTFKQLNIKNQQKILQLSRELRNKTNHIQLIQKRSSLENARQIQNHTQKVHSLENQLKQKQTLIMRLEAKCRQMRISTTAESSQNISFQEIMKINSLGENELMNSLRKKSQQIIQLKSLLAEYERKIDFMKNEADIQKLKLTTEEKNQKSHYEIDIYNLKGQLQSSKRKMDVVCKKLQNKTLELKRKDQFIHAHIVNKATAESGIGKPEVEALIEQANKHFGKNYSQRLLEAEEQILELKQSIEKFKIQN